MFSIQLNGFRTEAQALEFLNWYEGGGEQQFYDHLDIVGMTARDGCNIDVHHQGNYESCVDVNGTIYSMELKKYNKEDT